MGTQTTGQIPMRSGLTSVGMPGAPRGLQVKDPALADLLKGEGYGTAQVRVPTVHGFDAFCARIREISTTAPTRRTSRPAVAMTPS
jgi:hypothetical protein